LTIGVDEDNIKKLLEKVRGEMKRQDWVWAFAKAFGIYVFVITFRSLAYFIEFLMSTSTESPSYNKFFTMQVLSIILAFAASLILMLRTEWVMRLVGIKPDEEKEVPEKKKEEETWNSPESRKSVLWVFIKAIGIYLVLLASIRIPFVTYRFFEASFKSGSYDSVIGAGEYFRVDIPILFSASTEYIRFGIGICLIIFTGFFVRLVTKYGLFSGLKDKLKYAGEVE
jgi:hypothetical protein